MPELDLPELPLGSSELWTSYQSLAAHRSPGGMETGVLTWPDLQAWQTLMGITLTPWEADTLMSIERAVQEVLAAPGTPPQSTMEPEHEHTDR